MKLWIARNKYDSLWLFNRKPFLGEDECWVAQGDDAEAYVIDDELFPEVTFENSPQEVELKLVNNE